MAMKRRLLMGWFLLLVIIALALPNVKIADANIISALPNIYIKVDGTIEPSNATIMRNGTTYSLTDNIINYAIVIQCDNIILDGKGFTLQGRPIDTAVTLENSRQNVTIKNLVIQQFGLGISTPYLLNSSILRNTLYCLNGIHLSPLASNNQIINNTLAGSDKGFGGGIWIWGSYNNIQGNKFYDFHNSIEVYEGDYNIIADNVLSGTSDIVTHDSNNTILRNNLVIAESSPALPTPIPEPTSELSPAPLHSPEEIIISSPSMVITSPTSSPTVPELPWLVIIPLMVLCFLLLSYLHRKTANLKQLPTQRRFP
jgi:parallel beta-helix repeat protein